MAYPTDLNSMTDFVSLLMQDTSLVEPALSSAQKIDQINAAAKFVWSEKAPHIEFVPYDNGFFTFGADAKVSVAGDQNIDDILACYQGASAQSIFGTPLERIELHDMLNLHGASPASSATLQYYAVQRTYSTTNAQANKFSLWIYPPSDGTASVAVAVRRLLDEITGVSTLYFTPEEIGAICRLAAWACSTQVGRDTGWSDAILQPLPDEQSMLARKYKSIVKPTRRRGEEPL